tara:strand:+ start:113 stop:664 length:552 start_codon:yes stop_codon:yes gene_type:complete
VKNNFQKQSFVIWFTGLSGSGKTTIAKLLKKKIESLDTKVIIIDGDEVRSKEHKSLGFSRKDIRLNNRFIAEKAKILLNEYSIVMVPIISPYSQDRKMAKKIIGSTNFYELFIKTSIEECIKRDTKGLYKKAIIGEVNNLIGFSDSNPYEPPINPDISLDTSTEDVTSSVNKIYNFLINKKLI